MKKRQVLILSVALLVTASFAFAVIAHRQAPTLIRQCPDAWIENRMPTTDDTNSEKQYFVFNGERKEVKNYDVSWIKNNCSVQIKYVY